MNDATRNELMEKAIQAATDAGACCPKSVAAILEPHLYVEQSMAGPVVCCSTKDGVFSLLAAIAQLRHDPTIKGLFKAGAGLDYRHLTMPHFIAIREHNPELVGLAPRR
jgi:hypothetical protein